MYTISYSQRGKHYGVRSICQINIILVKFHQLILYYSPAIGILLMKEVTHPVPPGMRMQW